ncbi:lysophosphatidic acid receptor 4-like [Plectropomus leopardus]|uniref:lysophosphatidic acid receptor 4-like n=1 Tax=Plectropomus leopardus TaxID=160734 RepID=UPI001C4AD3E2|nr:lysophosphatidic acid receptor 4-like [Plectropomus leopardus]
MFNITFENGTEVDLRNTAYALVFGSVTMLGLPLNAVSLWILLRSHSLKSPSNIFMVNLAISDLLLVITLTMRVYFYATGTWPLGNMACIWITMLFRNNIRSSSIFITFISMDRLLAVVYPLRSRHLRTSSNASKAVALVWLFVLVVNIPEGLDFARSLKSYNVSTCFEFRHKQLHRPALAYFQPVLVLTLLAVNVVSTALVSWTLRRHLNDSARIRNKVNVMLIFAMNLMMFIIFFLPVSLLVFFKSWGPARTPLICLASVNCCLDPLLYYFSFDGFWKRKEDVDTSVARE